MTPRTETAVFRNLSFGWTHAGTPGKPILLFLHGFPDSPETWASQLSHFEADFEILCPHARGSFLSEPSSRLERYSRRGFALDCLQMLDRVDPGRGRPVLCVGHDVGTVYGSFLAELLGDRLKGLVLLNGLPLSVLARRLSNPRQLAKSWYILALQIPFVPEWYLSHFSRRFVKLAHRLGGARPETELPYETVRHHLVHTVNQYRAFVRELLPAWRGGPRRLKCPVLVLWGSRDAFVVPPTQAEIEAFAERGEIRILQGNHWLHRDEAPTVNRLLAGFFETALRGQARPVTSTATFEVNHDRDTVEARVPYSRAASR